MVAQLNVPENCPTPKKTNFKRNRFSKYFPKPQDSHPKYNDNCVFSCSCLTMWLCYTFIAIWGHHSLCLLGLQTPSVGPDSGPVPAFSHDCSIHSLHRHRLCLRTRLGSSTHRIHTRSCPAVNITSFFCPGLPWWQQKLLSYYVSHSTALGLATQHLETLGFAFPGGPAPKKEFPFTRRDDQGRGTRLDLLHAPLAHRRLLILWSGQMEGLRHISWILRVLASLAPRSRCQHSPSGSQEGFYSAAETLQKEQC